MNRIPIYLSCLLTVTLYAASERDFELSPQTTIHWATPSEAQSLLSTPDTFTKALSPFDRAVRVKSGAAPDPASFLTYVGEQALEWSPQEIDRMKASFQRIKPRLNSFDLRFPEQILMIKTTGLDEPAPYTRQNAIILSKSVTASPRPHDNLLAHELFHVLSRHAPREIRSKLYALLGFKPCPSITLPEEIKSRRITNPDSPLYDHFIQVQHSGDSVAVIPILLSQTSEYDPNNARAFFSYLEQKLIVIEHNDGRWQPKQTGNQSVILDFDAVSDFYEQIGGKRYSVYQPEEMLARHFTALIMTAPIPADDAIRSQLAELLK